MSKVFIDRNWCIDYVLLALESIENSANKGRTVQDFLEEIQIIFNIYTDERIINRRAEELLEKYCKKKILLIDNK